MSITISEIAERTGHALDKRFIERLHYWTREDLLKPLGKRNPGKGQRRAYPDTADQDALLLNAMLTNGVSVTEQQLTMKKLLEMRQTGWPPKGDHYLVIENVLGRAQAKVFFGEGRYKTPKEAVRVSYFNLTILLSVLKQEA